MGDAVLISIDVKHATSKSTAADKAAYLANATLTAHLFRARLHDPRFAEDPYAMPPSEDAKDPESEHEDEDAKDPESEHEDEDDDAHDTDETDIDN